MIILLASRAGSKAKRMGYKPTRYYWLVPMVWLGVEFSVLILIVLGYRVATGNELEPFAVAYIPSTLLAFLSVVVLLKRIGKLPKRKSELSRILRQERERANQSR